MTETAETLFGTKRMDAWLARSPKSMPKLDNPAVVRTAHVLLEACVAAGGANARSEVYVALVKTLAMVMSEPFFVEADIDVLALCSAVCLDLHDEITKFRKALLADRKNVSL